jgi:hypothetical protein
MRTGSAAALLIVAVASVSRAAPIVETTISSANFSRGYGNVAGFWGTSETSANNTGTTAGNFTFTPTVSGGGNSSYGPRFSGRVLSNGSSTSPSVADYGGVVGSFLVSVAATWTGGTPIDAQPSPNLRLRLNITSLRIWGVGYNGDSSPWTLNFNETTAGHTDSQTPVTSLTPVAFTSWWDSSQYSHVIWDPTDYIVSGTSETRTFTLSGSPSSSIDGFEIFGNVDFIYDAIPEPASVGFLAVVVAMALTRRRSR